MGYLQNVDVTTRAIVTLLERDIVELGCDDTHVLAPNGQFERVSFDSTAPYSGRYYIKVFSDEPLRYKVSLSMQ